LIETLLRIGEPEFHFYIIELSKIVRQQTIIYDKPDFQKDIFRKFPPGKNKIRHMMVQKNYARQIYSVSRNIVSTRK